MHEAERMAKFVCARSRGAVSHWVRRWSQVRVVAGPDVVIALSVPDEIATGLAQKLADGFCISSHAAMVTVVRACAMTSIGTSPWKSSW